MVTVPELSPASTSSLTDLLRTATTFRTQTLKHKNCRGQNARKSFIRVVTSIGELGEMYPQFAKSSPQRWQSLLSGERARIADRSCEVDELDTIARVYNAFFRISDNRGFADMVQSIAFGKQYPRAEYQCSTCSTIFFASCGKERALLQARHYTCRDPSARSTKIAPRDAKSLVNDEALGDLPALRERFATRTDRVNVTETMARRKDNITQERWLSSDPRLVLEALVVILRHPDQSWEDGFLAGGKNLDVFQPPKLWSCLIDLIDVLAGGGSE
mmetsp:Transcript_25825/g.64506  ORF Transcript_25825/g.64506 Transcript_25825/m.64506 type:complete len:273 (-) Transcript_25825:361-1179(-)